MARKAKHDQRLTPNDWTCDSCRKGFCNQCIDIMRVVVLGLPALCHCKRKAHSGEASEKQIEDPITGTVWGPGLRVTTDGEVINGGYSDGAH